jgi:hypothetical protein
MNHIVFIRNITAHDLWDYYDNKTEVWVFGTPSGYMLFKESIISAITAKHNVHLSTSGSEFSMKVVILPAQTTTSELPRLKFIERFVWSSNSPVMELVIAGNARGYEHFAKEVDKLSRAPRDPSEHCHWDDISSPIVIPRSVAINIRAPIGHWSRKGYKDYAHMIETRGDYYLPKELLYRAAIPEEYTEITLNESKQVQLDATLF